MSPSSRGARLKTCYQNGGGIFNVTFRGIQMHNVRSPLMIDMFYCGQPNVTTETRNSLFRAHGMRLLQTNSKAGLTDPSLQVLQSRLQQMQPTKLFHSSVTDDKTVTHPTTLSAALTSPMWPRIENIQFVDIFASKNTSKSATITIMCLLQKPCQGIFLKNFKFPRLVSF